MKPAEYFWTTIMLVFMLQIQDSISLGSFECLFGCSGSCWHIGLEHVKKCFHECSRIPAKRLNDICDLPYADYSDGIACYAAHPIWTFDSE